MTTLDTAPVALTPAELSGRYTIDPTHSRMGFVARHAMVTKVRGAFNAFEGTAVLDFADPSRSSAAVSIEVESIDTRQAQRDAHLRTNDFFDAPSFPTITFTSTAAEQVDGTTFRLHGDLTIKGVTKPVTFDLEFGGVGKDPWGNTRAGFTVTGTINRKDFGMAYNAVLETGGIMVGEKVSIELDIEATLQA
jgi:polyisoprenoid-binding protein YceI